ncbi:ATP-binding protein [Desertivirga arenae]|uniref:ATP-binding protein n=1 Tax=Desertivirga arenae TaxID=2810309 RepID=UPI001A975CC9|nr:ATP-binding protein [Pedobacter sp. SYSU D00823]
MDSILNQGKSQVILQNALLNAPYPIVVFEGTDFRITYINDALLSIWGKTKEVIGSSVAEALPKTVYQPLTLILKRVFETGTTLNQKEAWTPMQQDGKAVDAFFDSTFSPIKDDTGNSIGILGMYYDVTASVIAKRRSEDIELKFRNTVSQAPVAMALLRGADFVIETANEKSLEMWQKGPGVIGKRMAEAFPEYLEQGILDILTGVFETGKAFYGTEVPFNITQEESVKLVYSNFVYQPVFENGAVTSIIAIGYDVTDLVLERKKAQERGALLEYLNKAGNELALSLDTKTALEKISKLIVPKFADFFTINVIKDDIIEQLYVAHQDPKYVELSYELRKKKPIHLHGNSYTANTVRSGQASLIPVITHEILEAVIPDKEQLELLKTLNLRSSILVPFSVRDRTTGCINLLSTTDGKHFGEEDLQFAKDFATRIALTLENARLYEEQQEALEHNKRLLREVEFERNRFEAVMKQMPGAVVIAEAPSGKIVFANEKLNAVWGFPVRESGNIEQYNDRTGFHPDGRKFEEQDWPMMRAIKKGEYVTDEDIDIIRGDGRPAVLRMSSAPIKNGSGEIIAGVVICQDVTELKNAIRSRDEFLSIASHELKTPLTTLMATLQMLMRASEKEPETNGIHNLLAASSRSASKLGALVKDLLSVSAIQAGQLSLNKTWFNFSRLIENCSQHVTVSDTHQLVVEGDLDLEVFADENRLEQVIVNFISNAIKFSPKSSEIRVLTEQFDGKLKLSVTDQGIGIEEEKLPFLFRRFYRADVSGLQYSGMGLGLYISAEIMQLHQGEIGLTSKRGAGSTFWFSIPFPGA